MKKIKGRRRRTTSNLGLLSDDEIPPRSLITTNWDPVEDHWDPDENQSISGCKFEPVDKFTPTVTKMTTLTMEKI